MKEDIKTIVTDKTDYSRLIKYYKRKLVDYGVMKELRKYVTQHQKYKRDKLSKRMSNV